MKMQGINPRHLQLECSIEMLGATKGKPGLECDIQPACQQGLCKCNGWRQPMEMSCAVQERILQLRDKYITRSFSTYAGKIST
jgi:hypothetical protein